jgi:hypothetical protein
MLSAPSAWTDLLPNTIGSGAADEIPPVARLSKSYAPYPGHLSCSGTVMPRAIRAVRPGILAVYHRQATR